MAKHKKSTTDEKGMKLFHMGKGRQPISDYKIDKLDHRLHDQIFEHHLLFGPIFSFVGVDSAPIFEDRYN